MLTSRNAFSVELGHLGRLRVGEDDLARDEQPVDLGGAQRALRREAADDAVVGEDLDHDPAGQHPLGAVGEVDVGDPAHVRQARSGRRSEIHSEMRLGRARRRRRLEDDDLTTAQHRRDGLRRRAHVPQVRLVVSHEGGRHGDEVDGGVRHRRRRGEEAVGHGRGDGDIEVRLDDGHASGVDLRDRALVDVDAGDPQAVAGEGGAGGQADVAEADDGDSVLEHGGSPVLSVLLVGGGMGVGAGSRGDVTGLVRAAVALGQVGDVAHEVAADDVPVVVLAGVRVSGPSQGRTSLGVAGQAR